MGKFRARVRACARRVEDRNPESKKGRIPIPRESRLGTVGGTSGGRGAEKGKKYGVGKKVEEEEDEKREGKEKKEIKKGKTQRRK